jgi:hypothetical protein
VVDQGDRGSLGGSVLAVCTVTGRLSLCAATRNAGSSSVWAKKLFAGTTISVSLELPVTYAPRLILRWGDAGPAPPPVCFQSEYTLGT